MEEGSQLWNLDKVFWDNYLKGRPKVPDSFFERIFNYHAKHSGNFENAHDAGAGPGVHSARLAKRFGHVLLSDPAEKNIVIMRKALGENSQFDIRHSKLEDVDGIVPGSMDLVFAGVMIHFVEQPKGIESVAHQLKPGGTFASGEFGIAFIKNPAAQRIWTQLFHQGVINVMNRFRAAGNEAMFAVLQRAASMNGAVPLPEEYFKPGAIRLSLNHPECWSFYDEQCPPQLRHELPQIIATGPNDVLRFESETGREFTADMTLLKIIMSTYTFDPEGEGLPELWDELGEIVGDGSVDCAWPAELILATRR
ncbi:hypothetical protein BAUCODRAFT_493190 [Baudoinia panamericana UAMH 10762]|uniref:Methyltransferase type 11 domain-containing protein n=1 Tax=Baudoinia panamericana (strain UAMH 10762) TaxID=717646 RepID=M2N900_BAUPA|nr:uncharacterized protein BAUCODRAFT_493190 [Baudoinia panamericana UAMH 10762]EMC95554.1 hypothetical protein BAUCODRAFT_493190 [Baudoinia panamericana UAMH 10762]